MLFTGEQFDAKARAPQGGKDVGLYYLRARYYDPSTGRFLTRDRVPVPARRPAILNAYLYVLNNPVRYVDPMGLKCTGAPWDWGDCLPDELTDPFTGGTFVQNLIAIGDVVPLSYGCAAGGFFLGGPSGAATGYAICETGEKVAGLVAAYSQALQIAGSECGTERKAAAGFVTLVNAAVDLPSFPWDLLEKPIEVGAYVAVDQLLDCAESAAKPAPVSSKSNIPWVRPPKE
jgi:RHS repeat-associated protein